VLHETTHDMLIRSKADFVSVWNANNMALVPLPSGDLANQLLDVARAVGDVRLSSSDESVMQLLMTSWSKVHGPAGGPAAPASGP